MARLTFVSVTPLPEGMGSSDVAGLVSRGQLRISSEGTVVLVMPPTFAHRFTHNGAFLQEVRNLSCDNFRPEVFEAGVRILAVFGVGREARIKLWGKPVRSTRAGIWVWTMRGLQFKESLDTWHFQRRGPYDGAIPVGRNQGDRPGFRRWIVPGGHALSFPETAEIKMCMDGSVVSFDAIAHSAKCFSVFGNVVQTEDLSLPSLNGPARHVRWGADHLFFLPTPGVLWSSTRRAFLDFGEMRNESGWRLEQVWGSPQAGRLVLLHRLARSGSGGVSRRRLTITEGFLDSNMTFTTLAEGRFRIPPSYTAAWSSVGEHLAIPLQEPAGETSRYTSSLVTSNHEHTSLPDGTQSVSCVVSPEGGVSGVLARQRDGSSSILLPGTTPYSVSDAWNMRFSGGAVVWDALILVPGGLALARMSDAPSRPPLIATNAVA